MIAFCTPPPVVHSFSRDFVDIIFPLPSYAHGNHKAKETTKLTAKLPTKQVATHPKSTRSSAFIRSSMCPTLLQYHILILEKQNGVIGKAVETEIGRREHRKLERKHVRKRSTPSVT